MPAVGMKEVGQTWKSLENILKWFSKLVTTHYGWSDAIIKSRQSKVNSAYKNKKANEEAERIQEEQDKREKLTRKVFKRDNSEWTYSTF
jgi:hypothetical protein